mgnify:CR=1 FL=1
MLFVTGTDEHGEKADQAAVAAAANRTAETLDNDVVNFLSSLVGALAHSPRLLLLDEPTSGLDPGYERRLMELLAELAEVRPIVRAEKLGQKAVEYDAVHTIQRAREMGSVDAIIPAERLRPELIAALERGMERALAGLEAGKT